MTCINNLIFDSILLDVERDLKNDETIIKYDKTQLDVVIETPMWIEVESVVKLVMDSVTI